MFNPDPAYQENKLNIIVSSGAMRKTKYIIWKGSKVSRPIILWNGRLTRKTKRANSAIEEKRYLKVFASWTLFRITNFWWDLNRMRTDTYFWATEESLKARLNMASLSYKSSSKVTSTVMNLPSTVTESTLRERLA